MISFFCCCESTPVNPHHHYIGSSSSSDNEGTVSKRQIVVPPSPNSRNGVRHRPPSGESPAGKNMLQPIAYRSRRFSKDMRNSAEVNAEAFVRQRQHQVRVGQINSTIDRSINGAIETSDSKTFQESYKKLITCAKLCVCELREYSALDPIYQSTNVRSKEHYLLIRERLVSILANDPGKKADIKNFIDRLSVEEASGFLNVLPCPILKTPPTKTKSPREEIINWLWGKAYSNSK